MNTTIYLDTLTEAISIILLINYKSIITCTATKTLLAPSPDASHNPVKNYSWATLCVKNHRPFTPSCANNSSINNSNKTNKDPSSI